MLKGTYLLFMTFICDKRADVGSLGTVRIDAGEYCYVGSAMNGLRRRIERHLSSEKIMHWHIDRLTVLADRKEAFVSLGPVDECELAAMAEREGCIPTVKGFGCSDCRCRTHLFTVDERSKQRLLKASDTVPFSPEHHI